MNLAHRNVLFGRIAIGVTEMWKIRHFVACPKSGTPNFAFTEAVMLMYYFVSEIFMMPIIYLYTVHFELRSTKLDIVQGKSGRFRTGRQGCKVLSALG